MYDSEEPDSNFAEICAEYFEVFIYVSANRLSADNTWPCYKMSGDTDLHKRRKSI